MRQQIEALLQQDEDPNSFLNRPAVQLLAGSLKVFTGTRVGAYEILEPVGSGGMGEVYRARDTKLHRDVALKFLPAHLAADPDRLSRFRREAQILAALNRPDIAQIYGLEEFNGTYCIAMEFVEGETLADRVRRGPIPVDEALQIARDIAEALEAAHEKGIVHRDLKPANVKVTPEGQVKVLDFGLAKAQASASTRNLADSPTLSIEATNTGVILGTAPYMSPEQAKGAATDHRTDVFSFGCVLYEMLTGRRTFQGETVSDVIASVLARDPDLSSLPAELNPKVRDLIRRCLEKDIRRRWHAIADVRVEIETILEDPRGLRIRNAITMRQPLWKRAIPLVVTALVATAIAAAVVWNMRPPASGTITRFNFTLPEGTEFLAGGRGIPIIAIATDGSRIAFAAKGVLFIRDMSDTEFHRVPTAEQNIGHPFFSPDGRWLAFFSEGTRKLKKILVTGGAPVAICDFGQDLFGASWDSADQILIGAGPKGIQRVSAAGGNPETIISVNSNEFAFTPQLLPDRENILFTLAESADTNADKAEIVVQSLRSSASTVIIPRGSNARFVPPGHILYTIGSTLWAQPFNVDKLQPVGEPVRVVEDVARAGSGTAELGFSSNGVMAYVADSVGSGFVLPRSLALIDLDGKIHSLDLPPRRYSSPRFSADGKQIALNTDDGAIWIYDLSGTKPLRKLTIEGNNRFPVWTPDGHVAFAFGNKGLFWQRADGSTAVEPLMEAEAGFTIVPFSVSTDGRTFIFGRRQGQNSPEEIMMLSLDEATTPKPLWHVTRGLIPYSVLSPDSRWLAYQQNWNAYTANIYVEPFPRTGAGPYPITMDGGWDPMWSVDGKRLFYVDRNSKTFFAVDVLRTAPSFEYGKATRLFSEGRLFNPPGGVLNAVDFSPKRNQFVTLLSPSDIDSTAREVTVVLNWLAELKQRVPQK